MRRVPASCRTAGVPPARSGRWLRFNLFFSSSSHLLSLLSCFLNSPSSVFPLFQPLCLLFASQFVLFFLPTLSALLSPLFTSVFTLFCLSANSFSFSFCPQPFLFSFYISLYSFTYCHSSFCIFYRVSSTLSSFLSTTNFFLSLFNTFPFYHH